jgi:conjugal transfer pilus assembly protein TraE
VDKRKYSSAIHNANFKVSFMMLLASGMLVANIGLAYFVVTVDIAEKTIVVPTGFDKSFSIQGDQVSAEYIELMAKYFGQHLLTYHKQNIQSQFDTVLRSTDPSIYGSMKTRFAVDAERISRNDISSVFYLMSIHVNKNVAVLMGEQVVFVGSQLVDKKQKSYEIGFKYDNGKLTLASFNEVKKSAEGNYELIKPQDELLIEQQMENVPHEQRSE